MGVRVRHWKGSWWVFVTYRRRRKAKLVGDRRAAEEIASKLRARLLLGDLSVLEKTREIHTIQTYGERWLETYAAVNCKPRTLELYSFLCRRHLFPALGGVRLTDLTREQARTLLAEKIQGGMKRTTALKIVALLREILTTPSRTVASLLIQRRESLAYVKEQLGHHSIQVTVDLYGHLMPGANRSAVDRLAAATSSNLYATTEEEPERDGSVSSGEFWSRRRDLNPRPADYESAALPLSYTGARGSR